MLQAFLEIRALHKLFSAAEGALARTIGGPTCVPGCGKCCAVNVPYCTILEGIHAASVLTGTGLLKEAADAAEFWLTERHSSCTLYEGMPHGFKSGQLISEWQAIQKSPCPFLAGTECSVHIARPLTCRAYGVFRDGGGACPRPLGKGESESRRCVMNCGESRTLVGEFKARCRRKQPEWMVAGFFPAMLLRATRPHKLRDLVESNRIASAKLIGIDFDVDLMWQPQLDMLRQGKTPAEIMQVEYLNREQAELAAAHP